MAIVFVHGVANRFDHNGQLANFENTVKPLLRRYVAPQLCQDAQQVPILLAYWGEAGAHFAWHGESRPRTIFLGQGAEQAKVVSRYGALVSLGATRDDAIHASPPSPHDGEFTAGRASEGTGPENPVLDSLEPDDLSDLLAAALTQEGLSDGAVLITADLVAHDPAVLSQLKAAQSLTEQVELLREQIQIQLDRVETSDAEYVGMGSHAIGRAFDSLFESVSRAASVPGLAASSVLLEVRKPLNDLVTLFLGDVLIYLTQRGTTVKPGLIPQIVLETLTEAKRQAPDESLIVISHSMGGQIIYDLVTYFIPVLGGPRIDFWAATASQVGLFEEMKLLAVSAPEFHADTGKVPFPDRKYLGYWWNVWDTNDIISYTAAPMFEGVDDEGFNGGVSFLRAHGEYLKRPSFYRQVRAKMERAFTAGAGTN